MEIFNILKTGPKTDRTGPGVESDRTGPDQGWIRTGPDRTKKNSVRVHVCLYQHLYILTSLISNPNFKYLFNINTVSFFSDWKYKLKGIFSFPINIL
jgi:hypothetical protein